MWLFVASPVRGRAAARGLLEATYADGVSDLIVDLTSVTGPRAPAPTRRVVEDVLGSLPEFMPEEAGRIAVMLPADLRALWLVAGAG